MKFLNLDLIKQQCRIEQDFHDEDSILEMYGGSAEDSILNCCNRSMEEIIEEHGEFPVSLIHAALLLVDMAYNHRSPVSVQQVHDLPTFNILVKPYVKL